MSKILLLVAVICAVTLALTDILNASEPHQAAWLGASLASGFASWLVDR